MFQGLKADVDRFLQCIREGLLRPRAGLSKESGFARRTTEAAVPT